MTDPARILLVDDDIELATMLSDYLVRDGFEVLAVPDGESGVAEALSGRFALVVLDVMMPGIGGIEALRRIRAASTVPVLMLTARGDDLDRIVGLELGADDYVPKPCLPRELAARLRAILRRREGRSSNRLVVGGLSYNTGSGELRHDGQPLALTPRESALIELLMARPGEPVAKSRIVTAMSSWETNFSANAVEIYVLKLRRKLAGAGVNIVTLRGVGYALEVV